MSNGTGYELHRLEVYNWGNFHDLQRLEFSCEAKLAGPLGNFNAKNAAVITGINGSGKTTLIDPVFCVLMPFQNRINLGVIADSEKSQRRGSGRSIKDYILGKHSASDEERPSNPERYFSRKTGVSAAMLIFRHRETGKMVSVARTWWYSDYNIKEDQGFLLVRGEASIQDANVINLLKEDGTFFENASAFRRGMKGKGRTVEVFNTATEHLQVVGRMLNYEPDDIVLLNKAFYIKSITNIDSFVRDNMLLEQEKESVGRLCENIQRASEIFRMIKHEETKLELANRILSHLDEASLQYERQFLFKVEIALAELLQIFRDRKRVEKERDEAEKKRDSLDSRLPELDKLIRSTSEDLNRVRAQLSQAPVAAKLQLLDSRRSTLRETIAELKGKKLQVESACKALGIVKPKSSDEESRFHEAVTAKLGALRLSLETLFSRTQQIIFERAQIEVDTERLNRDLEHYSRHSTLIPQNLYNEKFRCIKDLGLEPGALMFVGELLDVPKKHERFRRAAESVLRPISRNLLCHPEVLSRVGRWINENNLRSNITAKRISASELNEPPRSVIPRNSILHYISVRPEGDNPFYNYLNRWIRASFWHEVVSVEEFDTQLEKAVTVEGSVKSDARTMSKYMNGFDFSLGWDSRAICSEIKSELVQLGERDKSLKLESDEIGRSRELQYQHQNLASGLLAVSTDFLMIGDRERELDQVEIDIKDLSKKNPDHQRLLELERSRDADLISYRDELSACKTNIDNCNETLIRYQNELSQKEASLSEGVAGEIGGRKVSMLEHFQSMTAINSRLDVLDDEIKKKNISPHEYKKRKEKDTPSPQQSISQAGIAMNEYKKQFEDPDLVYTPPSKEIDVKKLSEQWSLLIKKVNGEGLPAALSQFQDFYTETLFDSTKAAISDINGEKLRIERDINSINDTLMHNNFERLADGEERFLQLSITPTRDEQITEFNRELKKVQATISSEIRVLPQKERAERIMQTLEPFVKTLEDAKYRQKVVDARNHYNFSVKSFSRGKDGKPSEEKETFRGAGSDGKSGGQTAQLCYALLAASIACRFNFYDPVRGRDTLRIFLVDEFTGKFDNEKPQDVMRLLDSMGFQPIVLTPMSKLETLRGFTNRVVFVHKRSATRSVANSVEIVSDDEKTLLDTLAKVSSFEVVASDVRGR